MARISGVDLPRNKRIEIGLTYVFGIGNTSATQIVKAASVSPSTRCSDLTDEEINQKIKERNQARDNKDFQKADQIRDELAAQGILLDDSSDGTSWKKS